MVGESSNPFHALGAEGAAPPAVLVPFEQQVALLRSFLARRAELVVKIEALLNAQRKPAEYRQDAQLLASQLEQCFFSVANGEQALLRRQLEEAHWASGFKPRRYSGHHNDLVDPAEMMTRAFALWQSTRWPGHRVRVHYAHTLFNLYLLRRLMLLAMRLWDAGRPSDRLAELQRVLDELRQTSPADQPVFVRDARWLFPLAQSPTTDELHGYFVVAERIGATMSEDDRIAICSASVRMAGGHLRSQLRHVSTQKNVPFEDHKLTLSTRRSNALDLATLIQGLVPLLAAYERAVLGGDDARRLELADAILQGVSPDPELFLNRLDLVGPYGMIEHLFVAADANGRMSYTQMGRRYVQLASEYTALIERVAKRLHEDCASCRPTDGTYSPYGVLYGFSSRLLEHMALKATQPDTATRFALEDVFVAGDADKLAWVGGWRKLPHVPRDVAQLFDYPQKFAEEVFARIEAALDQHGLATRPSRAGKNGRLFVLEDEHSTPPSVPELPAEFIVSSDRQLVAANKATAYDETSLLHSRFEGEFLVSYRTPGGWVGITKDVLTEVLGAGRDAKIVGLPRAAAHVMKLMCQGFVVLR